MKCPERLQGSDDHLITNFSTAIVLISVHGSLCNHANDYVISTKRCKKYVYFEKDGLLYPKIFWKSVWTARFSIEG